MGVFSRFVDRAVNDESGWIDRVVGRLNRFSVKPHFDQAGGRDLVEGHSVRVDQEVLLIPWNAGRKVGEDQVIPAVKRHQAIGGSQVDAQFLLCVLHGSGPFSDFDAW